MGLETRASNAANVDCQKLSSAYVLPGHSNLHPHTAHCPATETVCSLGEADTRHSEYPGNIIGPVPAVVVLWKQCPILHCSLWCGVLGAAGQQEGCCRRGGVCDFHHLMVINACQSLSQRHMHLPFAE